LSPLKKKGAHEGPEGLLSFSQDEVPGGIRADVDLVNGLPPEMPKGGQGGAWPLSSKRKKGASRRAVADKAKEPLPGEFDG